MHIILVYRHIDNNAGGALISGFLNQDQFSGERGLSAIPGLYHSGLPGRFGKHIVAQYQSVLWIHGLKENNAGIEVAGAGRIDPVIRKALFFEALFVLAK